MLRFLLIKFSTYYQRIRSSSVITLELYVLVMSRTSFRVNPHSIVCLNVKELLTRSRHLIWSLSDSNDIQTHNHIVHKRTLNHLAKLASLAKCLSVGLRTLCLWVRISLLSLNSFRDRRQIWLWKTFRGFYGWLRTTKCQLG